MRKFFSDRVRSVPGLRVGFALGAIIVVVLASGCGSSSATTSSKAAPSTATVTPSTPAVSAKGKMVTVDISMFAFHPSKVTVAPGTTVAFTNKDTTEHTATADNGTTFDTGAIQHDQTKMVTITKAGTYGYHCAFHPFMTGTIIVK